MLQNTEDQNKHGVIILCWVGWIP